MSQHETRAHERPAPEQGSALVLSLFVTLVLSLICLTVLGHAYTVATIAGAERWGVEAFYAADSGLHVAQTRARIDQRDPFAFTLRDRPSGSGQAALITVEVDPLSDAGAPRLVTGSQANSGQGADETPIIQSYRTASSSRNDRTRAESRVEEIFGVGPKPPTIPD